MNKIKIPFVILVNLILQATIVSRLQLLGTNPNLTIPVIIGLAIGFGPYLGGYSALVAGLIEDMIFGQVLGVRALFYFASAFLIGNSSAGINKDDIRSGLLLTAFVTFLYMIYTVIITRILGEPVGLLHYLKGPVFVEMIFNTLLYIPVFYIYKKIFNFPRFRL